MRPIVAFAFAIPALVAVAACGGAAADFQAMSSGFVGCPPSEIRISRPSAGLGTWTWAAECRGRTYHCALLGQVPYLAQRQPLEQTVAKASSGVAAEAPVGTEIAQEGGGTVARCQIDPSSPPPPNPDPRWADTPAPQSAAVVALGGDVRVAQVACRERGNTWTAVDPDHATCSGAPAALGFPASTRLELCADKRICRIVVDAGGDLPGWSEARARFAKVKTALEAKYGKHVEVRTKALSDCQGSMDQCLSSGRIQTTATWTWTDGTTVALSVAGGPPEGKPELRVEYHHPKPSGAATNDGL